jgi:hypothetical protein
MKIKNGTTVRQRIEFIFTYLTFEEESDPNKRPMGPNLAAPGENRREENGNVKVKSGAALEVHSSRALPDKGLIWSGPTGIL